MINLFGYWRPDLVGAFQDSDLPSPLDFVDKSWDPEERAEVVALLKIGTVHTAWMGYSYCRFGCRDIYREIGTTCDTADGSWVWPHGLVHYVEKHDVRPPDDLVDHLRDLPEALVEELKAHPENIKAITAKWEPHQSGETCPERGTRCTYKPSGFPMCTREDPRGGSSAGARCQRTGQMASDDYEAERVRHRMAIAPFVKVPWESL